MGSLTAVDDAYVAVGCPGGPGHPSSTSRQLAEEGADDIIAALKAGLFNNDLKPRLLTMCQDELRAVHEDCFDDACEVIQLLDLIDLLDPAAVRAALQTINERED